MKNYTKSEIELRIAKLAMKPVQNAKLIAKWKRKLYKLNCN